jgi:hypothetical protein
LQIDHTPVDVIVVDQQKRLPIGRPWLTLAIDIIRTRMLAGFHVSLWAVSNKSANEMLDWMEEISLKGLSRSGQHPAQSLTGAVPKAKRVRCHLLCHEGIST